MNHFVFYHIIKLTKKDSKTIEKIHNGFKSIEEYIEEKHNFKSKTWFYQIFPLKSVDILIWFTIKLEDKNKEKEVFSDFLNLSAKVLKEDNIELIENLWGFTKKSVYVKNERSPQEIDPFSEDRKKFFIVYPFIKNTEWYLLKQDSRQGMMIEHIRIGKKYPQILQLLIYSFGLSDQEFVVAYECDSLIEFEELVQELRSSDARKYTLRDTPIYTSIFREPEELIKIYSL